MIGPARSIEPKDYQEYKKAMIQIHQINLKKKKKKGKKKKWVLIFYPILMYCYLKLSILISIKIIENLFNIFFSIIHLH